MVAVEKQNKTRFNCCDGVHRDAAPPIVPVFAINTTVAMNHKRLHRPVDEGFVDKKQR